MGKINVEKYLNESRKTRWYLSANQSDAAVYQDVNGRAFRFVERVKSPKGSRHEAEFHSDRPGRGASSAPGASIRHGLERRERAHDQASQRFARHLGEFLAEALDGERFDELVIAAEPRFLGMIRKNLPARVRSHVSSEVAREFSRLPDAAMRKALREGGPPGK